MKHIGKTITAFWLFLAMATFSCVTARAEMKVVERSAQKAPAWLAEHPTGCLVAIAEGQTLQEARNRAEQELLRSVVNSIAVNVEGETKTDGGTEGDREWDDFRTTLTVRAAQLPFISGITLAKCSDIYWEHSKDKTSGREAYQVYALYPFSDADRGHLIKEYQAYDARQEDTLNELADTFTEVSSLDEAADASATLEALAAWFPDALRRTKAERILEQYRGIRNSLALVGGIVAKGKCRVRVMRGDRVFRVAGRLEATSDCASDIAVNPDEEGWTVSFNTDDCLEGEPNSLTLQLRASGLRLKTSVSF